jgi:hypothetical protein
VVVDDGPVFAIHVVWHPSCAPAERLAHHLFTSLYSDPFRPGRRGLGIRVRYRTSRAPTQPPPPLPPGTAGRIAIVVLVDAHLVVQPAWCEYVAALVDRAPADLVIPVALTAVRNLPPDLRSLRTLDLTTVDDDDRARTLLNRVMHDMALRLDTSSRTVKVFLSHAKHDGLEISLAVRRHFHEVAGLDDFFDAADVPFGARLSDEITSAAGTAVALLAVQTDSYSRSEWCQLEILEAKRRGVPIVALSAVRRGEHRAFPYLGNVPVVRWNGDSSLPTLVNVLLREVLRARYFPRSVRALCRSYGLDPDRQVTAFAPELLTTLEHRRAVAAAGGTVDLLLYPDPPLGTAELEVLRRSDPQLKPVTPLTLLPALRGGRS